MSQKAKPGMWLDEVSQGTTRSPYSVFREFPLGRSTAEGCPIVTHVRLEEGELAPRHAHGGWTINVIVAGSCRLEDFPDIEMRPGHVLTCEPNVQYGPLVPGVHGVTLFEIFDSPQARLPTWADPSEPFSAAYEKWLATHSK
jgi:hypothetical protein